MPRAQKLGQLTPNKVYSIEGTVKFVHESEGYITAVIEQESVQKKIKIPSFQNQILEGNNYKFVNCFYNSKGWLMARKPAESIQPIRRQDEEQSSIFAFNLQQISENINQLETKYFSTFLKVYQILPQQILSKNGKDIKYHVLKGYSQNNLIDVTIWNTQIESGLVLDKWILFQGIRIKKMTENKFVLVSTVFTKLSVCDWEIQDQFVLGKIPSYNNLSQIYQQRNLSELALMQIPQTKIFSIIRAKVKFIVSADYEGCPKCRRKIQERCEECNTSIKANYSYGKVILEDANQSIEVIVFDQKIRQLFKFAKENCSIEGQIKTFGRVEEGEKVISHILTKINSIFF